MSLDDSNATYLSRKQLNLQGFRTTNASAAFPKVSVLGVLKGVNLAKDMHFKTKL